MLHKSRKKINVSPFWNEVKMLVPLSLRLLTVLSDKSRITMDIIVKNKINRSITQSSEVKSGESC